MPTDWKNQLYYGDNLAILREHLPHESVDLVYIDPPFNSNANYNVLFRESTGQQSRAQITAFEDTWEWGPEASGAYHEVITTGSTSLSQLLQAMYVFLGASPMMAYLAMMAPRLAELHRVLKPQGSFYLHCDPTASHYLKLLLDAVFGPIRFRNEIVWKRTSSHGNVSTGYGDVTDTLLYFAKGEKPTWNQVFTPYSEKHVKTKFSQVDDQGRRFTTSDLRNPGVRPNLAYEYKGYQPHPNGWAISREKMEAYDREGRLWFPSDPSGRIRLRRYLDECPGSRVQNLWDDIPPINSQAQERLGYPTQKPETLLERIIRASSNEGDVVLDGFCGCGTTISVAERLRRRWIGIDITHIAISLMRSRLNTAFGPSLSPYVVLGDPKDLSSASALAAADRHQFEWWSLGLIEARPAHDRKKGADGGIDGRILFFDDESGQAKQLLASVKSGHVNVSQVRDLRGVLDREKAAIGVLVTLEPSTKPMRDEALSAGYYVPEYFPDRRYPRLQILTIAELLAGKQPEYPRFQLGTFKKAPRQTKVSAAQGTLAGV